MKKVNRKNNMKKINQFHGIKYAPLSDSDDQDDGNLRLPVFEDGNGGGVFFSVPKGIVGSNSLIKTRSYEEIVDSLTTICYSIWYDRHLNERRLIEQGSMEIVDGWAIPDYEVNREAWNKQLSMALELQSEYESGNLDLPRMREASNKDTAMAMQLGMLSALRWVMGADMYTTQT